MGKMDKTEKYTVAGLCFGGDVYKRQAQVPADHADFLQCDDGVGRLTLRDSKLLGEVRIAPVSYTHLDVYKRQELDRANASAKMNTTVKDRISADLQEAGIDISDSTFSIKIGADGQVSVDGIQAVSYTHLPVAFLERLVRIQKLTNGWRE